MKNLKDILSESILGDIDDTLNAGDKLVKQEVRNRIKTELSTRSWYTTTSDEIFNIIVDSYEQLDDADKKGSRWILVLPDKTSTFKPIFVNIAKGIYRFTKNADKELYGTTASAMHKRVIKQIKMFKDEGLSAGWIPSKSIAFAAFLMNEYTQVDNISGNDWYTISIYNQLKTILISYNPTTKEWAYGSNNKVPSFVNDSNIGKFSSVSDILVRDESESNKPLYIGYMSSLTSILPHGNPMDFKKTSKFWKCIKFAGGQDNGYKNKCVYVHTTNFVYLTPEDITINTTNNK